MTTREERIEAIMDVLTDMTLSEEADILISIAWLNATMMMKCMK